MKNKNPFIEEYIRKNELLISEEKKISEKAFVKLYIESNEHLANLGGSAKLLFQFIFMQVGQPEHYNKTIINFGFAIYKRFCEEYDMKAIGKTAFFQAKKELIEKNIIAETGDVNCYFFNLNYFFNGDRLTVAKTYIKEQAKKPAVKVEEIKEPVTSSKGFENAVKEISEQKTKPKRSAFVI